MLLVVPPFLLYIYRHDAVHLKTTWFPKNLFVVEKVFAVFLHGEAQFAPLKNAQSSDPTVCNAPHTLLKTGPLVMDLRLHAQPTLLREYKEGVGDRVAFATEYAVERKEGRKEGRLEIIFDLLKDGTLDARTAQERFSLDNDEISLLEERLADVSLENNSDVEAKTPLSKKPAAIGDGRS